MSRDERDAAATSSADLPGAADRDPAADSDAAAESQSALEKPEAPETPDTTDDQGAAPGGLGRASIIMAAGTFTSRALGLVRNVVLVAAVGVNLGAANAFDVANKVPSILYAILAGGMLNAILVPQIVKAQRSPDGKEYVDRLLTLAGTIMLVFTLLMTLGASWVVGLYIDGWSPELTALAVAFGFWCIPQLFFYGLYTLLGQVLNARKQFGPFMWAPAVNNIISIIGFGLFIVIFGGYDAATAGDLSSWTPGKIALLGGVATLGVMGQALILIIPLWRSGFRWRPRWGFRGVGLGSAGRVAIWTFGAIMLDQIGVLVVTRVTSNAFAASGGMLGVAGNNGYTQALMIYLLPHSLITVSIATALFTHISVAATAGDLPRVRADLSLGMRTVSIFTVFASAALFVLAIPLTRLALISARNPEEVISVAQVVVAMSFGLVPLGAMVLMKWVFYAFEDGRTVFQIQVPVAGTVIGGTLLVSVVLPPQWWAVGAGAVMALANLTAVLLRLGAVRRRLGGIDGARILRLHVRLIVAAVVTIAVGLLLMRLFGDVAAHPGRAVAAGAVVGLTMLAVYLAALRAMRVRELGMLIDPIKSRLTRRR